MAREERICPEPSGVNPSSTCVYCGMIRTLPNSAKPKVAAIALPALTPENRSTFKSTMGSSRVRTHATKETIPIAAVAVSTRMLASSNQSLRSP